MSPHALMAQALALVWLPVRPGDLAAHDREDLGCALAEVGRAIAAGKHPHSGTILVPYQRKGTMKISIDLSGPTGKMWELDMKYSGLPPEYTAEIAAVAKSYEHYIANLPGNAGSATPQYSIVFRYEADGAELDGVSGEAAGTYRGSANKRNLLYSQAIEVQDAGIALLTQLQQGAHREIKSGQRK